MRRLIRRRCIAPSLAAALVGLMAICAAPAAARLPFAPPPPPATAPAPIPAPAPWFAASATVPLDRLGAVANLPLAGEARVQLRVSGPLPRFGLALVVDAPAVEIGGQPVGRFRARVFVPLDGDGVRGRVSLDGPAGRLWADVALPERLSPGIGLIEAALAPWATAAPAGQPGPPETEAETQTESEGEAASDEAPSALDTLQEIAADWAEAPVVRLRFEALDLERLTDLWPDAALAGRATGTLSLDAAGLRAEVELVDGAWRGGALGPARARVYIGEEATRITAHAAPAGGRVRLHARVPTTFAPERLDLSWRDRAPMTVDLAATGITPQALLAVSRFHPAADFEVDIAASLYGSLDTLDARATARGTLRDGEAERPLDLELRVGPQAQDLRARIGEADAPLLALVMSTPAPLVPLRRADADPAAVPLGGTLDLALPLATLMPYLPAAVVAPRGALSGQITASGTLGQPRLDGAVGITDGALTVVAANARLFDLDLALRFAGDHATVETLAARSGRGRLDGGGVARWTITPAAHAGPLWSAWRVTAEGRLALDDIPLVRPGLPAGLLDAGVRLDAVAEPAQTTADIRVEAVDLRLTGFRLADARPIARNGAVRRRSQGTLRRADAWLAGDGDLDLTLHLPGGRVEGDDTALEFGGAVTVRRRGDDFTVDGGIETRGGRFRLFDNPFELTGGRFSIEPGTIDPQRAVAVAIGQAHLAEVDTAPAADPLDPTIDVRAAGRVVETDVKVRIVGPSRRPSLILESDPPLPEYQILTLLITGRVDAIDERNGEVRRQAAKLIDRFHNPSLARQLYDRLGVDKLGLKFGASVTNPILTVGKQINRRLYVETVYHHDAPPDANEKEARVEYRLSPRWTVDTVAGDAGEGSLGLFWQTTFGRPEKPAAEQEGEEASP